MIDLKEVNAIYQSLFDPSYLKSKEKALSQNPFFIQKIKELRTLLQEIPIGGQNSNLNAVFFERFYQVFPFIDWQKSQLVSLYQKRLNELNKNSVEAQKFNLLKSIKTEPLEQQKQKAHVLISQISPQDFDRGLAHILAVELLKNQWFDDYQLLLQRLILPSQKFSEIEKNYLKNLPESLPG